MLYVLHKVWCEQTSNLCYRNQRLKQSADKLQKCRSKCFYQVMSYIRYKFYRVIYRQQNIQSNNIIVYWFSECFVKLPVTFLNAQDVYLNNELYLYFLVKKQELFIAVMVKEPDKYLYRILHLLYKLERLDASQQENWLCPECKKSTWLCPGCTNSTWLCPDCINKVQSHMSQWLVEKRE